MPPTPSSRRPYQKVVSLQAARHAELLRAGKATFGLSNTAQLQFVRRKHWLYSEQQGQSNAEDGNASP